jgi:hypothetical protein
VSSFNNPLPAGRTRVRHAQIAQSGNSMNLNVVGVCWLHVMPALQFLINRNSLARQTSASTGVLGHASNSDDVSFLYRLGRRLS